MTRTEPDAERPRASTEADVALVGRGVTVAARVIRSDESDVVVSPMGEGQTGHEASKPGDSVEVYWASGNEERTRPARVVGVDNTGEPQWHLGFTGPAQRSQRRGVVRAKVAVPVVVPWAGGALRGTTIDLSERGLKALVDGWGLLPETGDPVTPTLSLEDDVPLDLSGEVAWISDRGTGQWLLAVMFTGVSERAGDTLRRRVFQALREERARDAE